MLIQPYPRRGQNTAEYAILIGVVAAALITMQVYIRRGLQARIKNVVDYTKNGVAYSNGTRFFSDSQYEPYYAGANLTTVQSGKVQEEMQKGLGVFRNVISDSTSSYGSRCYGSYLEDGTFVGGEGCIDEESYGTGGTGGSGGSGGSGGMGGMP